MTYELRKQLEDLSIKAYGTSGRYKKIQRDGVIKDMEAVEDAGPRKYRGLKYYSDIEMITVMQDSIKAKEEAERLETEKLKAEQNKFADIPKLELKVPSVE